MPGVWIRIIAIKPIGTVLYSLCKEIGAGLTGAPFL